MKSPHGGAVASYHVEVWQHGVMSRSSGHEKAQAVFFNHLIKAHPAASMCDEIFRVTTYRSLPIISTLMSNYFFIHSAMWLTEV